MSLPALRRVFAGRLPVVLALATLGVLDYALRVWMLGRYAAPPSGDYGIYLADARALIGQDVTGFGSAYPPVFLLPLDALLLFVDPITAVRFYAPVAILFLPFPFYRIASRYSAKPWAFLATLLFVTNEGYSEMTGWGGGPDLMSTAFLLASLAFFLSYLDSRRRRDVIVAGVFAGLVVGTHHLTALVYVFALLGWLLLECVRARSAEAARPFLQLAGWSALFSLPFAPYYLGFGGALAPQVTPIWPGGLANLPNSLQFLFRESPLLWVVVAALALVGGYQVLRARGEGFAFLSLVLVSVLLGVLLLQDNPTRPLYYLYIPILLAFPAFFTWVARATREALPDRSRRTVWILLVAFAVVSAGVMAAQSTGRMSTAVDWYHAVNPSELDAMNWIRANTPANATVATAGVPFLRNPEGTRIAWWLEGYAQRRSFYGGSPIYAALEPERTMVEAANEYFAGDFGEQHPGLRMVENAPASLANPAIAFNTPRGYVTGFFLNDAVTLVGFENASNPGLHQTWSPYFWVPTVTPTWTGGTSGSLRVERQNSHVTFVRGEALLGDSVVIDVSAAAINGTVDTLDLPVWVGWETRLSGTVVQGDRVSGQLVDSWGSEVPFNLTFSAPTSTTVFINATNADPTFGQPAILVRFITGSPSSSLSVRLVVSFPGVPTGPVQAWSARSIGAAYGVDYILQFRSLAEMFYRFDTDHQHFRAVYQNSDVVVYEVL